MHNSSKNNSKSPPKCMNLVFQGAKMSKKFRLAPSALATFIKLTLWSAADTKRTHPFKNQPTGLILRITKKEKPYKYY